MDENATAIDGRMPTGATTLAKLDSTLNKMMAVEGSLEDYVQYPGSHCLNGGVIRGPDGRRLVKNLASHHYLLLTGHHLADIELLARVFELEVE